jgi:hypothetical protein
MANKFSSLAKIQLPFKITFLSVCHNEIKFVSHFGSKFKHSVFQSLQTLSHRKCKGNPTISEFVPLSVFSTIFIRLLLSYEAELSAGWQHRLRKKRIGQSPYF